MDGLRFEEGGMMDQFLGSEVGSVVRIILQSQTDLSTPMF